MPDYCDADISKHCGVNEFFFNGKLTNISYLQMPGKKAFVCLKSISKSMYLGVLFS